MDTQPRHATSTGATSGLADRIRARTATVGLVGLGYVGLPLLLSAAREGFAVIGVDADPGKIASLLQGRSYVVDISDADLAALGSASFTTDPSRLQAADIVIIAVPTPLTDGVPDLALVLRAGTDVMHALRPGQLVVLESTTYPGTTEEVLQPILESSGLRAGVDFALAYSPERIDPAGSWDFRDVPKIVAGITPGDTALVELFYSQLVAKVVTTPTPREAEMAKLIENTFRQVNIALVNELAMLAPELDVDIWAALDAASSKPYGYMPFWPGPGVGGHCIAIDPSYLTWRVGQRLGFSIGFIERAKEVNSRMPRYIANRVTEALNAVRKPLNGSRIMAVGLAYKAGVNDVRESPSLAVVELLGARGAVCVYHDPYVPVIEIRGDTAHSQPLDPELIETQDCVVILTAHPGIDYEAVVRSAKLVFDARGVTRGMDAPNVVRL